MARRMQKPRSRERTLRGGAKGGQGSGDRGLQGVLVLGGNQRHRIARVRAKEWDGGVAGGKRPSRVAPGKGSWEVLERSFSSLKCRAALATASPLAGC
jgi:hypothetical protein